MLAGLFAVGAAYFKLHAAGDADLANKVGATGVCAVLFIVGLASYLTARKTEDIGMDDDSSPDAEADADTRDSE